MAHKIAKLILEKAATFLEREAAVRAALRLGMPLREIEEYLDWLDLIEHRVNGKTSRTGRPLPGDRRDGEPSGAECD